MGIVLLVIGLVAAGVVADFAAENASGLAGTQAVDLFGQTFHLSTRNLVLAGAILVAAAVLLIGLGVALLARRRHASRRALEIRVDTLANRGAMLEAQNAVLTQENANLRTRAMELERQAAEGEPDPVPGFGRPSTKVSETALLSPPVPRGDTGEPTQLVG